MTDRVRFVLDEGYSCEFAKILSGWGFLAKRVPRMTPDNETIREVAASEVPAIWITKDTTSARDYRDLINNVKPSIAFVRSKNAKAAKLAFLTISFMYRFEKEVAANPSSLFLVTENSSDDHPRAVVKRVRSLEELRRPKKS